MRLDPGPPWDLRPWFRLNLGRIRERSKAGELFPSNDKSQLGSGRLALLLPNRVSCTNRIL